MVQKIDKKRIIWRILAVITAACLFAYGPIPYGSLKEAKGAEDFYVDLGHGLKPLSINYFGVVNDFNVRGGAIINVNEPFGYDLTLPASAFTHSDPGSSWGGFVDIYLMPVGKNATAEGFVQAYMDNDGSVIQVKPLEYTTVPNGETVDYSSDDLTFYDHSVPASGYYHMVALVYEKDYIKTELAEGEGIPVIMVISRRAFAFSNPTDGGNPGPSIYDDPYEGAYTILDVSVVAGGETLDDTAAIVYSSDGLICYGTAPCAVPAGIEVAVELRPGTGDRYLQAVYRFPSYANGEPYITTVPSDGHIEIYLEGQGIGAIVSGRVTDENGEPVTGAYVSASPNGDIGVSAMAYTDVDGFYSFVGLYVCDYTISASKKGLRAGSSIVYGYDMNTKTEVTRDFVLKNNESVFSLKIKGNADKALFNIIMPDILEGGISLDDCVSGEYLWTDTDTLSFMVNSEEDLREAYTLIFNTDYILEDSITVSSGSTAEVNLANIAGFRGFATYKDGRYGNPCVQLFDEAGERKSVYYIEKDDYAFAVVLPKGSDTCTYKTLSFGVLSRYNIPDAAYDLLITNYPTQLLSRDITLKSGQITDLGESELSVFEYNFSTLSVLSFATVTGTAQNPGDVLKITGHIEDTEPFTIKGLRVYGYSNSDYLLTAVYKENSLVINGHAVDASFEATGDWHDFSKLIKINEDITGPVDFTCSLSVHEIVDTIVRVEVDIKKDGINYNKVKVGDYSASVYPITLKAMHRTSTGMIKCSGHASKGSEVKIWEGEKLLGMAYANEVGKYEIMVMLPTEEKSYSFHRLHATSEGNSTDEIVVYYDKDTTAVESIAFVGGSTTGSWTQTCSLGFEAIVDNPEMLTEDAEFNVMCSNGTVVAVPVASIEKCAPYNGVTRSRFVSEGYPFGENDLLPVKVWFVYSSGRNAASDTASISFSCEEAPVFADGGQSGLSLVGEAITDPALNVVYDIINGYVKNLIAMMPKYAQMSSALDVIGVGEMVELYNQISEQIGAESKRAEAQSDMSLLSFMSRVSRELPFDVDTTHFQNDMRVARESAANAMDMIDRYREQSFYMGIANTIVGKLPVEYKAVGLALQTIISPALSEIRSHNDEAWSFYGESMRDAMRRFQLMTGLSTPELLEMFEKYRAGEMSGYDIRKILNERLEEKRNAEAEDSQELQVLIDPSGYVYEAVASNRIENAVVTLYNEGMFAWDAENYEQVNPLITDQDGRYAWDVPEGNWFVKVFREGYEIGTSDNDPAAVVSIDGVNYLPVLPPQLDVNIPLTSLSRPVASIEKNENGICLVFSKYVEAISVTPDTVILSGLSSAYSFTALDAEVSPAHTPLCGGKTLARTFRIDIKNGSTPEGISAEITDAVMGYNGISAMGNAVYGKIEESKNDASKNTDLTPAPVRETDNDETAILPEKKIRSKAGLIIAIIVAVAAIGGGAAYVVLRRKQEK